MNSKGWLFQIDTIFLNVDVFLEFVSLSRILDADNGCHGSTYITVQCALDAGQRLPWLNLNNCPVCPFLVCNAPTTLKTSFYISEKGNIIAAANMVIVLSLP